MLTSSELEGVPIKAEKLARDMQMRIMSDIVERVSIAGEIISTTDWQIQRLSQLGMSKQEIKSAMQDMLAATDEEIDELYSKVLKESYVRDSSLYKAAGVKRESFDKNKDLQKIIDAVREQTKGEFQNITQSMGFAKKVGGKIQFTPLAEYYQRTLDGAVMDITSGAMSKDQVLKRVVEEMTKSGIRTVDYASGRSYRVESAARTAIMTGFNQVAQKMTDKVARDLGVDTFEVSWHGGARPSHQVWQGRVYTRRELEEICGLGKVDGLLGANCYHSYNPFIPGVSKRNYTDAQLEKMNAEENEPKYFEGRPYTKYEALQMQRKMELKMRKLRQDADLLTVGGGNRDDVLNVQIRNRILGEKYAKFSEAMELPMQMKRVTIIKGNGSAAREISVKDKTRIIKESVTKSKVKGSYPSGTGYSELSKRLQKMKGVDYIEVKKAKKICTVEEIVEKLMSRPKEYGSCTSQALAYIGNRHGLDVTDFRGGRSMLEFAKPDTIKEIAKLPGVVSEIVTDTNDYKVAEYLFGKAKEGKEYLLSLGQHSAIVKKENGKIFFLELQTSSKRGYNELTRERLRNRFKARTKYVNVLGQTMKSETVMIDVDSFAGNQEFTRILGYLNTKE